MMSILRVFKTRKCYEANHNRTQISTIMPTDLSTKDLIEITPLINQYHIRDFSLLELGLTNTEYSNATQTVAPSVGEEVQKGLKMWLNKNKNDAKELKQLISKAVSETHLHLPLREVIEKDFEHTDTFRDSELAELSRHFQHSEWETFATVYLDISPTVVSSYEAPKGRDLRQLTRGILERWKCKEYSSGTAEELMRLMEIARDRGRMDEQPIAWLRKKIDLSENTKNEDVPKKKQKKGKQLGIDNPTFQDCHITVNIPVGQKSLPELLNELILEESIQTLKQREGKQFVIDNPSFQDCHITLNFAQEQKGLADLLNRLASEENTPKLKEIEGALICRSCSHRVVDGKDLIPEKFADEVLSRRYATLLGITDVLIQKCRNPYGYEFELITVRQATAKMDSDSYLKHTWFHGYAWSVARCQKCSEHLGWGYTLRDTTHTNRQKSFVGVIIDKVTARSD